MVLLLPIAIWLTYLLLPAGLCLACTFFALLVHAWSAAHAPPPWPAVLKDKSKQVCSCAGRHDCIAGVTAAVSCRLLLRCNEYPSLFFTHAIFNPSLSLLDLSPPHTMHCHRAVFTPSPLISLMFNPMCCRYNSMQSILGGAVMSLFLIALYAPWFSNASMLAAILVSVLVNTFLMAGCTNLLPHRGVCPHPQALCIRPAHAICLHACISLPVGVCLHLRRCITIFACVCASAYCHVHSMVCQTASQYICASGRPSHMSNVTCLLVHSTERASRPVIRSYTTGEFLVRI